MLSRQEECESGTTDNLCHCDLGRHVLCNLRRYRNFTAPLAFSWLKRILREAKAELTVHGEAPAPDLIFRCQNNCVSLSTAYLGDLNVTLSKVFDTSRALEARISILVLSLVTELASL